MKKSIWKYLIGPGNGTISMPKEAEILTVQMQGEFPCIWAMVNPESEKEDRSFEIFGTGEGIPSDIGAERKYIGTFQLNEGQLVFHLFERK